ncbi:MAG: serine/threonine protein kinase [Microcoleaceae cyanobacterium]
MNPNPLHQFGDVVSGRYLITTPLRQDEFGITYGAQDFIEDRRVMVRVFSLSQQKDWKILDWFQQEVRLLTQLDHPGIPKYYNHFVEDTPVDQRFYLVQEFIEGEFLSDLLAWGWRASEADLRHIASQILEILIYLHRPLFPIIHQNIHPSNIICQSDGKVFLVNFGTAHYSYSLEPRNHIDHPGV